MRLALREVTMRIRQLRGQGFPCWPPVWVGEDPFDGEEAVLQGVEWIAGTTLLKISAEHGAGNQTGLLIFEKELLYLVYQKLKENIGRPLTEVGDLEIED